jgi:hypothetical protein
MSQPNQALRNAIAAAERLPLKQQHQLAEQLLAKTSREQQTITVRLRRLPPGEQTYLAELMDKNNDGVLSRTEEMELKRLDSRVNEIMLANSVALARALRPELFDMKGRPVKARIRQAVRHSKRENSHR